MAARQAVNDAIESLRDDALSLLQTLVQTPSLEGDEKACQEIVEARLRALGLDVDVWTPSDEELEAHPAYVPTGESYRDRPNVVGTLKGKGSGRSLLLAGHVDVVPTGPEETWTHSPWSGHVENGRVYGRGSCDMKAGVVSNIIATEALMRAGVRLNGDVLVVSVVDEEAGGNGTLAAVLRGHIGNACIFTEPTGLDEMAISGRGAQFFRITVPGQSGGTEYKHELISPITKAIEVFNAVEAYSIMRESAASHPLYDGMYDTKVPTGICKFQAGEWPSTVPEQAVLEGTIECLPGEDIHVIKDGFRAYLEEWSAKDPWLKDHPLKLVWFGLWFESAEIPSDHPMIKSLAKAASAVTGAAPAIRGGGGSDLRLPILYGDTPTVLFGPAGGRIHSADEYVEFEQVIACAKVLAEMAIDWCGEA
ncbi:MAG: ArgE/DapE family deacylase [Geminicoccaceae bacterium]